MNYKTRKNRLSDSTMNSDSINVYNDDKFETIPAIGIHRLIKTQVRNKATRGTDLSTLYNNLKSLHHV